MERTYIIFSIHVKDGVENPQFYPWVAGEQTATENEWNKLRDGYEECIDITSKDVNMGSYFDKVFKAKNNFGRYDYWGMSSVWKSRSY